MMQVWMQNWNVMGSGVLVPAWIYVPAFLLLWGAAGYGLRGVLFARLRRLTAKTDSRLDDIIIEALSLPIFLMIAATGIFALGHWTPFGDTFLRQHTNVGVILKSITILSGVLFVDRLLRGAVLHYSGRVEILRTAGGLLQGLVRALVVALGALVLLDSLGISITPILASLGIGSLAVAFALQPTLENFFAGVQIIVDRPILPGHFVKLDSGEEGWVEKIGGRSTWIRTPPGAMIILPNKTLIAGRITNYHYPQPDVAVVVPMGVHYNSDLAQVERLAVEVARGIQTTTVGAVRDFEPAARFHTFGGSSVDVHVVLRAVDYPSGGLVKHEFIKAVHARFAKEGVVIPYPITALNLDQENAAAALARRGMSKDQ